MEERIFCIDAALALLGKELQPERNVRICIEKGVIRKISFLEKKPNNLILIPGLVNAHIHVLDYAFAGIDGIEPNPFRLLPWPRGTKARAILSAPCRAIKMLREGIKRLKYLGYAVAVAFIEGPGSYCKLFKILSANYNLHVLTYGRAHKLELLRGCDGLGAPQLIDKKWFRLVLESRERGFKTAAHVSETVEQSLLGDYEYALIAGLDHAVHLLHTPPKVVKLLTMNGTFPVLCLCSNIRLWRKSVNLIKLIEYGVEFGVGGDNLGWCPQNPWELMRHVFYNLVENGFEVENSILISLKAFTIWPLRHFVGVKGIEEGEKSYATILSSEIIVSSPKPLYPLVEVCDADFVYDVVTPLTYLKTYSKP